MGSKVTKYREFWSKNKIEAHSPCLKKQSEVNEISKLNCFWIPLLLPLCLLSLSSKTEAGKIKIVYLLRSAVPTRIRCTFLSTTFLTLHPSRTETATKAQGMKLPPPS